MGTNGAILEGLRINRNPQLRQRLDLQAICERHQHDFSKYKANKNKKTVRLNSHYKPIGKKHTLPLVEQSENVDTAQMPQGSYETSVVMFTNDGDRYVGEVRDGEPDGYGTALLVDGSVYIGEWKNGLPHGRGHLLFTDGCIFVGTWKDGEKHGRGAYYQDGIFYCEYKNGKLLSTEGSICDKTGTKKKQTM